MKKSMFLTIAFLITAISARATEGMWIPSLINMFYSDMKTNGLKLKAEDIYATNKSSLKDAIVQFDGGCTAEIVSAEGLLLTNHHCGYDAIQKLSSIEKDYLKNGFWAKNKSEELACPWMFVTFVKEIREVSKEVLAGVKTEMALAERNALIKKNIAEIEKKTAVTGNIKAKIKPFNNNNQYFMLVTEDFNDIRLVGTPPNAIGKFGGDTDNWVWPRHTGDFSVFRIYANKENKSAAYDKVNQPFKPAHFLPISVKPRKEGDFTMVYGFPGRTDQHYCSEKIKFYQEIERPARIAMRTATMDQMKPAMNDNDIVRIKYSAKQASIANAWKKWIGQIGGLKALNAVAKKQQWEAEYIAKSGSDPQWKARYGNVINDMNQLTKNGSKFEFGRAMFTEYFYYGPEFINFCFGFNALLNNYDKLEKEQKLNDEINKLKEMAEGFFKDYDAALDFKIMKVTTPLYIKYCEPKMLPAGFSENWEKNGENIFKNSLMLQPEKLKNTLSNLNPEAVELLKKDPALIYANEIYNGYAASFAQGSSEFASEENRLLQLYVEGLLTMFPKKKNWADANSTLRIAYGKIEGSAPHDGMTYKHFTTIDGIMQKYDPANPDFELTQRFIDLYNKKDYGTYAQDGKLWVCFTASNHTTGGNSGSPVIDAKGNLLGINFDRSWESTMSDFVFDPSRCRNIVVDARYVLWVIEKYGEAGHLLKEMKLVR